MCLRCELQGFNALHAVTSTCCLSTEAARLVQVDVSLHLHQGRLQLQEIGTVCARALERQTRHTQLQQHSTATVLLDEGGLPGVSPALHGCNIPMC